MRELDLEARQVRTVVGRGLFDFGDRDGTPDVALLQHCIGIAADAEGRLVVADTYNGKLRRVDGRTGEVQTVAAGLDEPSGLSWNPARNEWLVADTNAHRIVRVSADGTRTEALVVTGAPDPRQGRLPAVERPSSTSSTEFFTRLLQPKDGASLGPGRATVHFEVSAPEGKKLAAGSPVAVALEVSRRSNLLLLDVTTLRIPSTGGRSQRLDVPVRVEPFDVDMIESEMIARIDAVVCDVDSDAAGAVCEPWRAFLRLPVRLARSGGTQVELA